MAFGPPIPAGNAPPAAAPAPVAPPVPNAAKSLAQVSAMGAATLPPGGTPTPSPLQAEQPAPAPEVNAGPPAGVAPARPVVAPHASARSVGTHKSRSPNKRMNAPHGMVQK